MIRQGELQWKEVEHQEALFKWKAEQLALGREDLFLLGAVPNGYGQIDMRHLRNYGKLGFIEGFPDLFLMVPRGDYAGLFIELKTIRDRVIPKPVQIMVMKRLKEEGYRVEICKGWRCAVRIIEEYLGQS